MDTNKNNNIDWGGWILAFILLSVFPPVGIFLLIKQIANLVKSPRGPVTRHPYDIQREAERTAQAEKTSQTQTSAQAQKTAQAQKSAQPKVAAQSNAAKGKSKKNTA